MSFVKVAFFIGNQTGMDCSDSAVTDLIIRLLIGEFFAVIYSNF